MLQSNRRVFAYFRTIDFTKMQIEDPPSGIVIASSPEAIARFEGEDVQLSEEGLWDNMPAWTIRYPRAMFRKPSAEEAKTRDDMLVCETKIAQIDGDSLLCIEAQDENLSCTLVLFPVTIVE